MDENDIDAYLTQIDFEKALIRYWFDFLMKCLKTFGLGDHFIKWVIIKYTDIK